jgi:hypothetical protein
MAAFESMAILSEAPQQVLCCQLNITKDRTQQTRAKDFAGMDRNSGGSSVRMAEKKVASASPDDFET